MKKKRLTASTPALAPVVGAVVLAWVSPLFAAKPPDLEQGRAHWSFQPLQETPPPAVRDSDWPRQSLDHFILAKLEAAGLLPSPEAERSTFVRRVTLDLTGLPPTPEEVAAFVHDSAPDAYEKLIDRLLDSPHYGEHWGRHWLDIARYADSSGFHNDLDRPYAWKYRDYVIRSFNEDKPYPQFVAEQLAGDEVDHADEQSLIATGFCRNGPSNDDNMGRSPEAIEQYRLDQLDDVIATTSTAFLGLTVGCARCHDHKTEPISAADYHAMLAIFNGTEKLGLPKGAKNKKNQGIAEVPQVQALIETRAQVEPTHILLRGSPANKGPEVGPAVPVVLATRPLAFPESAGSTSLRRLTLARWITAPQNALAWRVLANRVWQHHFGRGIVATPGDFGFTGTPPTHPELLDHLAARLIADEGRLKGLHRSILLSATYRQASFEDATALARDPDNSLLWRMNPRRLTAEMLRDSILTASGRLNRKLGGEGIKPRLREELLPASQRNKWPLITEEGPEHWRRSVYIYLKRQLLMPLLELFDAPTTTDSCHARSESVVPTQALVLMNDEFVEDQAGFLATRVLAEAEDDTVQAITRLFLHTLSRPPSARRLEQARAFVAEREAAGTRQEALADLAHVLFNSSEFVYFE